MHLATLNEFLILLLIYSASGVLGEVLFTGLKDLVKSILKYLRSRRQLPFSFYVKKNLPARVNLWCIPVYGISAAVSFSLIGYFAPRFFLWHWLWRGLIYALGIYAWEFVWALFLDVCLGVKAWEYNPNSKYRIWRYIALTHFFNWFLLGFWLQYLYVEILPRINS